MMMDNAPQIWIKLHRESLCRALSAEGNPEFATIIKVMRALDLKITARAG
jgi:probable addiction module antidote protein